MGQTGSVQRQVDKCLLQGVGRGRVRVTGEVGRPGKAGTDTEERMVDAQGPAELVCHPPVVVDAQGPEELVCHSPVVGDGSIKPHATSL